MRIYNFSGCYILLANSVPFRNTLRQTISAFMVDYYYFVMVAAYVCPISFSSPTDIQLAFIYSKVINCQPYCVWRHKDEDVTSINEFVTVL